MSYFDPNQVAINQSGQGFVDMQMRPFTGYAGPPRWTFPSPPQSWTISRGKVVLYFACWGFGIALALTFVTSPAVAIAGGFVPVALCLLVVILSALKHLLLVLIHVLLVLLHYLKHVLTLPFRWPYATWRVRQQHAKAVKAFVGNLPAPLTMSRKWDGVVDLVPVPLAYATENGFQVNRAILPSVEQVVTIFGVKVDNGYRDPKHNAEVTGKKRSDHLTGNGVDFFGTAQQMSACYTWAKHWEKTRNPGEVPAASSPNFPYVEPWAQVIKEGKPHVHISFVR